MPRLHLPLSAKLAAFLIPLCLTQGAPAQAPQASAPTSTPRGTARSAALAASLAQGLPQPAPALLTETREGFQPDGDGASSAGWRATTLGSFDRLAVRAGKTAASELQVSLGRMARFQLRLRHEGASNARLALVSGRAVYPEAFPSTDLLLGSSSDSVEVFYLLHDESAPRSFSMSVDVSDGLGLPEREPAGGLLFRDRRGDAVLRIPAPSAIDATGTPLEVTLDWRDGRVTVELAATPRAFPVLLDPAIEVAVWERRLTVAPPPRAGHSMAYDAHLGEVVLLGGHEGENYFEDTFFWDGRDWSFLVFPGSLEASAMVYDPEAGLALLFGGFRSANADTGWVNGDFWAWNGLTWSVLRAQNGPPGRMSHAMAYDRGRKRVVLFGGARSGTHRNDTWEWDGSTWTELNPATRPLARSAAAMVYDEARRQVVLFGGDTGAGKLGDTWTWNGTDWSLLNPAASPPARSDHALTYDASREVVVLYGGADKVLRGDTWEWNGSKWVERRPSNDYHPGDLEWHSMVYDTARRRVRLAGGWNGRQLVDDAWEWDGKTWTWLSTSPLPTPRGSAAMVYDEKRNMTILHGGRKSDSWQYGDTWEGALEGWTLRRDTPSAREGAAMAFDPNAEATVLFGGGSTRSRPTNDTWTFAEWQWIKQTPPAAPPGSSGAGMVFDTALNRMVLFGGYTGGSNGSHYDDTWVWDRSTWSRVATTANPPGRSAFGMTYDGARDRVLLFGGNVLTPSSPVDGSTWLWNDAGWEEVSPTATPSARLGTSLVNDPARGRAVLFGGLRFSNGGGNQQHFDETWEWDGQSWEQRMVTGPSARAFHGMAFDTTRRRGVLFGGVANAGTLDDTWEYYSRGGKCVADADCDTEHCVDGVCCEQSSCGTCAACDTADNPGACTSVTGQDDPDTCTGKMSCGAEGRCAARDGESCTQGSACASGFCVDGVCCDTACSGDCEACQADLTGGAVDGVCAPVREGTDPRDSCDEERPNTCGTDGQCDGSGRCRYHPRDISCGDPECAEGQQLDWACDGSGTCAPQPTSCGVYACREGRCLDACSSDEQCIPGAQCQPDHSCAPAEEAPDSMGHAGSTSAGADGCACRTSQARPSSSGPALAAALAAALVARKRRRRAPRTPAGRAG